MKKVENRAKDEETKIYSLVESTLFGIHRRQGF